MVEIFPQSPENNTGSDVLRRYRYQAEVAFPYCLECCVGDSITSVIMEHFEDMVIIYVDEIHFVQIKTRDPSRGAWTLPRALSSRAFQSLWRTYHQVRGISGKFGLYLEGAVPSGDPLFELRHPRDEPLTGELIQKVAKQLEIDHTECEQFLENVYLKCDLPSRTTIEASNLRLLHGAAPTAGKEMLERAYVSCVLSIADAMTGEPLGSKLPEFLSAITTNQQEPNPELDAKLLTRRSILNALGGLVLGAYPLINRVVLPEGDQPTALEIKLSSAGLPSTTIENAQTLRAHASYQEKKLLSASLTSFDLELEDAHQRLIVFADAIVQGQGSDGSSASQAWAELNRELPNNADHLDPNRLFARDPMTLLGVICDLTDTCEIDWSTNDPS